MTSWWLASHQFLWTCRIASRSSSSVGTEPSLRRRSLTSAGAERTVVAGRAVPRGSGVGSLAGDPERRDTWTASHSSLLAGAAEAGSLLVGRGQHRVVEVPHLPHRIPLTVIALEDLGGPRRQVVRLVPDLE